MRKNLIFKWIVFLAGLTAFLALMRMALKMMFVFHGILKPIPFIGTLLIILLFINLFKIYKKWYLNS